MSYIGRFAPSPTGPLHAGSLVAALASWLDAHAHGGQWLVRIEDVDTPRCKPGAHRTILEQLAACGLTPDAVPVYQSERALHYEAALNRLVTATAGYPCACTRQNIDQALQAAGQAHQRHGERVYPGTCRHGLHGRVGRAWRFNTAFSTSNSPQAQSFPAGTAIDSGATPATQWVDRRLGLQTQDVLRAVGDFVLRRADGLWAYQLAVVVDDAAQGVTHVVRGEDLADNTARQILLQRALGLPTPRYLHTPLVLAADGQKLSKQNGAMPLDVSRPLVALQHAGRVLGLHSRDSAASVGDWLAQATAHWAERYPLCTYPPKIQA
jgi:glutamyl-Q tRNA(Asp) synthetase